MKWMNKIISILLMVVMIGTSLPAAAVYAAAGDAPEIKVGTITGSAGEDVVVDVLIDNNTGIAGATLKVSYDTKLTLQKVERGDALQGLTFTSPAKLSNPCKFLWDSESGMETDNGTLMKLYFHIAEDVAEGDSLNVSVSYDDGDVFDENLDDVYPITSDGTVQIGKGTGFETESGEGESEPDSSETEAPVKKPAFAVESVTAKPGETVQVDVMVRNNPGIAGATLQVKYDPKLTLAKVTGGEALDVLTFTKPAKFTSPCKFLWDSESGHADRDGVAMTLEFIVSEDVKANDVLPVEISYTEGDIFDENLEDLTLEMISGDVTIEEEELNKEAKIYGASLRLSGDIGINFYYEMTDDLYNDPTAKVMITVGNKEPEAIDVQEAIRDEKSVPGKVIYKYTGYVSAKAMKEPVKVQLVADGYKTDVKTYSVRQYADSILARSTSKDSLKYLVRVMLYYGSSAQKYLKYNVKALSDEGIELSDVLAEANALTADQLSNYATVMTEMPDGITVYGANLSLKSETVLRYHFVIQEGHDVSEYIFAVDGSPVEPVLLNGRYCVEIENIRAQDVDEMFTVSVTDRNGNTGSVKYGALTYTRSILTGGNSKYSQELIDTVRGLYVYYRAAERYLGNK